MTKQKISCVRCRYLTRYYRKGKTCFRPTGLGWCMRRKSHVGTDEHCEDFRERPHRTTPPLFIRVCLSDLLTEISELRKLIEAESREDHEEDL